MANLAKLNNKISESHLKRGYIAYAMGITQNTLCNKLKGATEFKGSEIGKLAKILALSEAETEEIFF